MSKPNGERIRLDHTIPPLYDENSEILILGSFPSVLSRETGFFYGNSQNRFWRVVSHVFGCEVPRTIEDKKGFLLANRIALWDVIASCEISGSADSSITNAVPNDIRVILDSADIRKIFVNGSTAAKLYKRHILPITGREATGLPSTSPANASWSFEKLCAAWAAIR